MAGGRWASCRRQSTFELFVHLLHRVVCMSGWRGSLCGFPCWRLLVRALPELIAVLLASVRSTCVHAECVGPRKKNVAPPMRGSECGPPPEGRLPCSEGSAASELTSVGRGAFYRQAARRRRLAYLRPFRRSWQRKFESDSLSSRLWAGVCGDAATPGLEAFYNSGVW